MNQSQNKFKIVTYNLWNHNSNFDKRIKMIGNILKVEKADVIVLQEVRSKVIVHELQKACDMPYVYWKKYHDCEEGLAILSQHKILSTWTNWDVSTDVHNSGSMCIEVMYRNKRLSISNVHLDYKYALNREKEILKLTEYIKSLKADYNIMAGDFNTYPNSSIHGYLSGRSSLMGQSARWIDLGESYASKMNVQLDVTIDFNNNPRWLKKPILDIPGRFDWILLENPYPNDYPTLLEYNLIGKEIIDDISASDHYGIAVSLRFEDKE